MNQGSDGMATLGEFGSLLQLGFGVGIGLSVFTAPFEYRASALRRKIEREFSIVENLTSPRASELKGALSEILVQFNLVEGELKKQHGPALILALIGAFINLILLIIGSMNAQYSVSIELQYLMIFISSIYYICIIAVMDRAVHYKIAAIETKFKSIR